MLLKPPSRIHPSLGNFSSKARSKTPGQQRPSSLSPTIRKKFTPRVNKSFTCYHEKNPSKTHHRVTSLEKTREYNLSLKHSRTKSLKTSGKIFNQQKNSLSLESIKLEMSLGNHSKAAEMFSKLLKSETNNLEAIYSRGVCYMHLNEYEKAIKDFVKVSESDPIFDKQLYIALFMCFNSLDQKVSAVKFLSKGLRKFSGFVQGYLLRGQVYNNMKKYEKALQDFKKVVTIDKQQQNVLIFITESYIGLKDYDSALKVIKIASAKPELVKKALVLRCKVLYELKKYDEALADIDKILAHWPEEFQAFYYKAKINFDNKNYTEAALCFEQVLQSTEEKEFTNLCLYYLAVIKINERDFYGALHTFERSIGIGQSAELKSLHKYTEGVICLMKRKLEEGILIFSSILEGNDESLKEYIGNCYENRAFAYFSLKKYDLAIEDYTSAKNFTNLVKASEFNLTVSEAVLQAKNTNDITAIELFKASKQYFPKNIMPDLGRACILFNLSLSSNENIQLAKKSENLIDHILKSRDPESEVLVYQSIVKFSLKNFDEALEYAKKTIEKADENIAFHYIQRGFCHVVLKKYEEAVQDFNIALQLVEDSKDVYVFRGISAYLQDDLHQSLDDFLTASKKYPDDADLQVKIGKLLMVIGSYHESLEIFENMSSPEASFCEAKAYTLLNNFERALQCLATINKHEIPENLTAPDQQLLEFFVNIKKDPSVLFNSSELVKSLKSSEGVIFNKKYVYWMMGVILLYNKENNAANNYFQAVLEILHDEEPEIFADSITIEEENCEILYNLALCSLNTGQDETKSHALLIFEELAEVLNEKHRGQLLFLSAIIELSQKNKSKAEKLLKEAIKCDPETITPFINNQETTILPLHTGNELSEIFPLIPIKIESLPVVYIRPAVVLPNSCIDYAFADIMNVIKNFYQIDSIMPRPEPPWLLRVKGSIQFTDALLDISHDFDTEADENLTKTSKTISSAKKIAKSHNFLRISSFASEDSHIPKASIENLSSEFEEKIKILCHD